VTTLIPTQSETSGSTETPRTVVDPHGSLLDRIVALRQTVDLIERRLGGKPISDSLRVVTRDLLALRSEIHRLPLTERRRASRLAREVQGELDAAKRQLLSPPRPRVESWRWTDATRGSDYRDDSRLRRSLGSVAGEEVPG
jgi:hypothetical protein